MTSSASPVMPTSASSAFSTNPDAFRGKQGTYKQTTSKSGNVKQSKSQKHYHLPHFSSNRSSTKMTNSSGGDPEQKYSSSQLHDF